MKYIKTFEGLIDRLKSDKNWYLKLELNPDGSAKKYDYKGINLVLQGFVAVKKEKVNPLLDIIKSISEHWYLVDNRVDLLSSYKSSGSIMDELTSVSSEQHSLEFKISDTQEIDSDMPDDIADEIVEYVDNKFGIKSLETQSLLRTSLPYKENKLARYKNKKRGWIQYIIYLKHK